MYVSEIIFVNGELMSYGDPPAEKFVSIVSEYTVGVVPLRFSCVGTV